ncbi:MAG: SH3 domain-containing protein [Clostridiales bacterium]|nr:SH3 domain-containing protein [Clostridiales bacterium]
MKIPHKVLAMIAMLLAAITMLSGVSFAEGQGFVTAELLNIRKEPDKNSEVIAKLAQEAEVQITDMKGEWYQLLLANGDTGWAMAEFIKADLDVVQITADSVNIRKTPSTDGAVLTQQRKFDRFVMLDRFNDWFKIKLPNGESGWVNDQYSIIVGVISRGVVDGVDVRGDSTIRNVNEPAKPTSKMQIKGDDINFRDNPDLDADIVAKLQNDTIVTVLESSGEWRRIKTPDGKIGYINKMFLTEVKTAQVTTTTSAGTNKTVISKNTTAKKSSSGGSEAGVAAGNGTSKAGSDLVSYAKQFIGIRYKWGGTTTKGFDCSGFTQYVMKHFGVSIPRVSRQQATSGTAVKKANLRVGDIVYFAKSGSNRTVNHVGIYIGNGNFIHSSSGGGGRGVTISNLNSGSYATRYAGARRYLK